MDLNTLFFDGVALLALAALVAIFLGGIAMSVADLAGRDLGDRPEPGGCRHGRSRRSPVVASLESGVAR